MVFALPSCQSTKRKRDLHATSNCSGVMKVGLPAKWLPWVQCVHAMSHARVTKICRTPPRQITGRRSRGDFIVSGIGCNTFAPCRASAIGRLGNNRRLHVEFAVIVYAEPFINSHHLVWLFLLLQKNQRARAMRRVGVARNKDAGFFVNVTRLVTREFPARVRHERSVSKAGSLEEWALVARFSHVVFHSQCPQRSHHLKIPVGVNFFGR